MCPTDNPGLRVACPDCGVVSTYPDIHDEGTPVSGVCPGCGERLYWSVGSIWLAVCSPTDMTEGESPSAVITVTTEPGDTDGS